MSTSPYHSGRRFSPSTHHPTRFAKTHSSRMAPSRSFEYLPYVPPPRYENPRYRNRSDSPMQPLNHRSIAHSRNLSNDSLRRSFPRVHIPTLLPVNSKSDLVKDYRHLRPSSKDFPMFKQFHYPERVPSTPDKIHRTTVKHGKVNSTVTDSEMRPSYHSHNKYTHPFSPEPLSESEEELLYRAEEDMSERLSEPRSPDETCYVSASEGEAEESYQMYHSNVTSRSSSVASIREKSEKKKRRKKEKMPVSEGILTPLKEIEEEKQRKKAQKAQAPLSFPKPKRRPSPRSHMQYVTQPVLYPVPQPYPMPFPMYSPLSPPVYYPPPPHSHSMEVPHTEPIHREKREISTQYSQPQPEAVQTEYTGPQSTSAFFEALAEIDRKLGLTEPSILGHETPKALRKPVALEIGLAHGKSLAEQFKERLPEVSAKLRSRDSSHPRSSHKTKSPAQLLEIRKEMLRPGSVNTRGSNVSSTADSLKNIDPGQLERADRLAAGMSVVTVKKSGGERGFIPDSETPLKCITEEGGVARGRRMKAPVKMQ